MSPSRKVNRILAIVLVAFLGIALRAWNLGVMQRESLQKEAEKPQSKTLLLKADRGPIYDRFQVPLAVNRISYNASIYYNQIAQIPMSRMEEGQRRFPRKEYIRALSEMLGALLQMDPERIEDLIHAKASLFPHAPYAIRSHLTEGEYYRLKALEREWPGLCAEIGSERFYPMGKTGCHIMGMMGAISQKKYQELFQEQQMLKEAISLLEEGAAIPFPKGYSSISEMYQRLALLKEKAYTLSDVVGVGGLEKEFEEELRGYFGKKVFATDLKGKLLRELPGGKEAIAGKRIMLSISAELQQFAEELLIKNEEELEKKKRGKKPWIKGGAIVAIDPNNGEILAMASYPRFDPNDFIQRKRGRICEWLENEAYIAALWDGKGALSKERFRRKVFEEESPLSWPLYLQMILPEEGPLPLFFQKVETVKSAIALQEDFEKISYLLGRPAPQSVADLFGKKMPDIEGIRAVFEHLDPLLSPLHPLDRLFVIDLCRLVVDSSRFSDELIEKVGFLKLDEYRHLSMEWQRLEAEAKEEERGWFHREPFANWKKEYQKEFLRQMRREEKKSKSYAKPYLDYLDRKEEELFLEHWEKRRLIATLQKAGGSLLALSPELSLELARSFRSFADLDRPILSRSSSYKTEKELAGAFLPKGGFGKARSHAYQATVPQGSVFKLFTAYEGLRQGASPILVDYAGKDPKVVAYTLSGAPYPRLYKGGRLPRSSIQQIGKIDMIGAIEQSSNPYFSILAGDLMRDPEDLKWAAHLFGYGEKTGINLPSEAAGLLPDDLKTNRTGLYSFAIGQHTLLTTPLQSAVALSAIGNGGKLFRPTVVRSEEGFVKREIAMPPQIRSQILEGMDRTIWGEKGKARPSVIRLLRANPLLTPDFLSLKHQMVGKTGTAQILHKFAQNPSSPAEMVTYTWFNSIAFAETRFESPELVVVVFSRFADAGKEGAPLAAQIIKKWRELVENRQSSAEVPLLAK